MISKNRPWSICVSHIKADHELSTENKKALLQTSQMLAQEAVYLFEMKRIDLDELNRIYATAWEAQDVFGSLEESSFGISRKFSALARRLLDIPYFVEWAQDLLVGVYGEEKKEDIAEVMQNILGELQVQQKEASFLEHLGVQNLTWKSAVKRIAVVALSVLTGFVSLTFLMISVASKAMLALADWAMPQHMRNLRRMLRLQFAKACTKLFLSEEMRKELDRILTETQRKITQKGGISYKLSGGSSPSRKIEVTQSIPLVPKLLAEMSPAAARIPPDIKICKDPIRPDNALTVLKQWLENSVQYAQSSHPFLHFNAQISQLPVPGADDGLWGKVHEVQECMELLTDLALKLYQGKKTHEFNKSKISTMEDCRQIINLYKLYAIIDQLARRCPDSDLEDFTVNPWGIAIIKSSVAFRVLDKEYLLQFQQICSYFGIDSTKYYYEAAIAKMGKDSLFFSKIPSEELMSPAERRYLEKLLQKPLIQQRLQVHGVDANATSRDKMAVLYCDPPLADALKGKEDAVKKELSKFWDTETNSHKGILPRSFYLLRLVNFLSNHALGTKFPIYIESVDEPRKVLEKRDSPVRKVLYTLSRGRYGKQENGEIMPTSSVFRKIPFAFNKIGQTKSDASHTDIDDWRESTLSSQLHLLSAPASLSRRAICCFVSHFHSKPRSESEIVNNPGTFFEFLDHVLLGHNIHMFANLEVEAKRRFERILARQRRPRDLNIGLL